MGNWWVQLWQIVVQTHLQSVVHLVGHHARKMRHTNEGKRKTIDIRSDPKSEFVWPSEVMRAIARNILKDSQIGQVVVLGGPKIKPTNYPWLIRDQPAIILL